MQNFQNIGSGPLIIQANDFDKKQINFLVMCMYACNYMCMYI